MIRYIKRKNLEEIKYNACIESAIQSRIYAYSWYLDIVADYWDALVLDDYEAVMPIPWKKFFFLKHITQPYFSQQLGIFSRIPISVHFEREMLSNIPFKYLKVSLQLNANNVRILERSTRKNYLLKLSNEYEEYHRKFSKGRKHAIKVGIKAQLNLDDISIEKLIEVHQKNYDYKIPETILKNLVKIFLQNEKGQVIGVFKDGNLLGGGFFIQDTHRLIYLYAAFNKEGRKLQAASFLISNMIKRYQKSDLIFDFEGGNISNIGKFYRSFNAEEEVYSILNRALL
jgi:hypothetical protein